MHDIFGLSHVQWYSIFLLAIGLMLYGIVDRINYSRRRSNPSGWMVDRGMDVILRLMKIAAKLAVCIGLFFLCAEYISRR